MGSDKIKLLKRADMEEPFLRSMVNWSAPPDSRRWLYDGDTPAGFITLLKSAHNSVRVGAVYVAPEHRGKGLAASELKKLAATHRLEAFINAGNTSSQRLFENAGLSRGEFFHSKQAGEGYWYRNFNKQDDTPPPPLSVKHIIKTGAFRAAGRAALQLVQRPTVFDSIRAQHGQLQAFQRAQKARAGGLRGDSLDRMINREPGVDLGETFRNLSKQVQSRITSRPDYTRRLQRAFERLSLPKSMRTTRAPARQTDFLGDLF